MVNNSFIEASDAGARAAYISGTKMISGANYFNTTNYTTDRAGYLDLIPDISGNCVTKNRYHVWVPISGMAVTQGETVLSGVQWYSISDATNVYPYSYETDAVRITELNYENTGIPSGARIVRAEWHASRYMGRLNNFNGVEQLVYAPIAYTNYANYATNCGGSENVWRPIVSAAVDDNWYGQLNQVHSDLEDYAQWSTYDAGSRWFSGLPWVVTTRGRYTHDSPQGDWNWAFTMTNDTPSGKVRPRATTSTTGYIGETTNDKQGICAMVKITYEVDADDE